MSKFMIVTALLFIVALNLSSALRCNQQVGGQPGQANFLRLLAKRRAPVMPMALKQDNNDVQNEVVECPAGAEYCVRFVCDGKTLRACASIDEGHTPEEACKLLKPYCTECYICQTDDCN